MERKRVKKSELLFPELSYQLIGLLFDVHNTLGMVIRKSIIRRQ